MIESTYHEVHSKEWKQQYIPNQLHELVILRRVIPWQSIMNSLIFFYCSNEGATGKNLRMMIAIVILQRYRQLSDEKIIETIQENRYLQYFCNIPDQDLCFFLHPSSLCVFRHRLGEEGIGLIEGSLFQNLRLAGAIQADTMLMDSSVLENNIIYPNDVRLLYKAIGKMTATLEKLNITFDWNHQQIKQQWRAFNLDSKRPRWVYLVQFYVAFVPIFKQYQVLVSALDMKEKQSVKIKNIIALLQLLDEQTQLKLQGKRHIKNRIVSLNEPHARPIKKGKSYPTCEFGSTHQMTFNRQGYMVTSEVFIGAPNDKTLYPESLRYYIQRMQNYPDYAVTDLGYRSLKNIKATPQKITYVFLGKSNDVPDCEQDYCKKARSATEGFIAVAKHYRGFRESLYNGIQGDRIWATLCQCAYNLKKFLQLYLLEAFEERTLEQLGLL